MDSVRCKAFVAAVEEGSFTAAAKRMGYTPSGISQLVHALEEDLGFLLLTRMQKGVMPTAEGKRIFRAAKDFIEDEDKIYQLAAEIQGLDIGTVRIATFNSIATNTLPALIRAFSDKYPNIKISLREGSKEQIAAMLADRRADVGFATKLNDSYWWKEFKKDPIVAILPKDHPYADKDAFPIEQCAEEELIMSSLGNDIDVNDVLKEFHIEPHVVYTTLENYTAINLVEQGLGISIMNRSITQSWDCDVAIVPIVPRRDFEMGFTVPSLEDAPPAVQKFVRFVESRLCGEE